MVCIALVIEDFCDMSLLMNENSKINKTYIEKIILFHYSRRGINHGCNKGKRTWWAVEAKVDAVKFQMFDTNQWLKWCLLADYHKKGLEKEGLRGLLNRLEFSQEQYLEA